MSPLLVSTHSRPKAAGYNKYIFVVVSVSFNTQPPEGGWVAEYSLREPYTLFQHTAARRRLAWLHRNSVRCGRVSTHSRPKAAGISLFTIYNYRRVSTHSRPKAAGDTGAIDQAMPLAFQHTAARRRLATSRRVSVGSVSFNTQPPEGGWTKQSKQSIYGTVSTHSRPKAAGEFNKPGATAVIVVSTHSRPKAAGFTRVG